MTTEADLAVPPRLPLKDKKSIADHLGDAGFVLFEAPALDVRRLGAQRFQDASHGTAKPAPTYLELLAPLRGKRRKASSSSSLACAPSRFATSTCSPTSPWR